MRIASLVKALAVPAAGGLMMTGAALAAAPASPVPPAAPIFYCPKVVAQPQACPAPGAGHAARTHGPRVRRAHMVRRHAHRGRAMATEAVTSDYNPEDEGTSASQAWSYRYQLAQHGLYPWEVEAHHYRFSRRGEYEGAYAGREGDDEDQDAWRGGYDDDRGYDHRRYDDQDEAYDQGRGYDEDQPDERGGYDRGDGRYDRYSSGGGYEGSYSSRSGSSYSRTERRSSSSGGTEGDYGDYRRWNDAGGDVDADDDGGWGGRYGASHQHRFVHREHSRSGGYVEGEENGVPYGWSWGDMDGRGGHGRGGYADAGGRYGADHRAYVNGGGYVVGSVGGRRGVWYDTDDQAVPYAGRDAQGYLVWPGKAPR